MTTHCRQKARSLTEDPILAKNRKKTLWVLVICIFMMISEIIAGYISGSMALLADGFHMASHVGAMGIAMLAYSLAASDRLGRQFSFGPGKLLPLGGYTSAIVLAIVALLVIAESIQRFFSPSSISYNEAIWVAAIGIGVNFFSALILRQDHDHHHDHAHDHDHNHHHHHDHNIRSAFIHVTADVVTSVLAIIALLIAKRTGMNWLDPAVGMLGAFLILAWAFQLCRDTAWELMDGHSKAVDWDKLQARIQEAGATIADFHVWRIGPGSLACELIVHTTKPLQSSYFRDILIDEFSIDHVIVEVNHTPTP